MKENMSKPVIYFVCTGNAARSPMAEVMLRSLDTAQQLEIRSAGTLVIEGRPMGTRTRRALERHGLSDFNHRSKQFRTEDALAADLVLVMEPEHIHWIRVSIPEAAPITGMLRHVATYLIQDNRSLPQKVSELNLAELNPSWDDEVADPHVGDQDVYDYAADDLFQLVKDLYPKLITST